MNILLVSSYLPFPLFSGGQIRLYNLIKALSKKHSITLVCEIRDNQSEKDVDEMKKYCKEVYFVKREKQWSIKNIIRTGLSMNPFLVTGHTLPEMRNILVGLLDAQSFDLIHAETFYIMQNIPETHIPIVLVEHNIEYLVYKRYADRAKMILKPFLYIDVMKLLLKEKKAWKRASKLVAVSEDEKKRMEREDTIVVPNGVDTTSFTFEKPQKKTYTSRAKGLSLPEKEILFIGDFKWMQNVDAATWMIDDLWPFLLRSLEGEFKITLRLVGRNMPQWLKKRNTYDSILFDDNSPKKTIDIFHHADVLLSPTRVGGGTSYKIIEAMAAGTPVVTTSLGIEGIPAKDGHQVMVADDVQTIVEKVGKLLRDPEYYTQVATLARALVEKEFDWKIIAEKLNDVYESTQKK